MLWFIVALMTFVSRGSWHSNVSLTCNLFRLLGRNGRWFQFYVIFNALMYFVSKAKWIIDIYVSWLFCLSDMYSWSYTTCPWQVGSCNFNACAVNRKVSAVIERCIFRWFLPKNGDFSQHTPLILTCILGIKSWLLVYLWGIALAFSHLRSW